MDETWPKVTDGWLRYETPLEKKWALEKVPAAAGEALAWVATYAQCNVPHSLPDLSLYGAGLHMMGTLDKLDCHRDADRHPRFGLQRAYNGILFIGEWDTSWGGQLELWDEDEVVFSAYPAHNRLVLFDATLVHSVHNPIQCPMGKYRRSLAMYWWKLPPAGWVSERPRATFLPSPGSAYDPGLEKLRRERAQFNAT